MPRRPSFSSVAYTFGPGPATPVIKALIWANVLMFVAAWLFPIVTLYLGLTPDAVLGRLFLWQPFTYLFLHAGFFHIIFNMLFLWVFGNNVEDSMSRPRFLAFYLICGLVATTAQVLADPDSPAPIIGASGAIAGVLGAYLLLFPQARVLTVIPLIVVFPVVYVPAWILLLVWFGVQAVQGLTGLGRADTGVAFFAHVGGFVAGVLLVLLFADRRRRRSRPRLGRPPLR